MGNRHRGRLAAAALSSILLVVTGATAVAAGTDQAKKVKRADLIAKDVTASATGRSVVAKATVKNKPGKKSGKSAKGTSAGVLLSSDPVAGPGDLTIGALPIGKLPPKVSQTSSSSIGLADSVPAGTYYVVVCADAGLKVEEKKEGNNCQPSPTTVTIPPPTSTPPPPPPPPAATVTVTYGSSTPLVGTVSATPTNGTCTPNAATGGGVCTVAKGTGTVTLTANGNGAAFTMWIDGSSGPCDGVKAGPKVTFTAPAANKSCTAVFGV